MNSTLYLVQFNPNDQGATLIGLVKGILHGVGGIKVYDALPVYEGERNALSDYDTKVAFKSAPRLTKGVFKLPSPPIFIDNQYTVVYWGGSLDLYALFKKSSPGAWTVARQILPLPDKVHNGHLVKVSALRNPTVSYVDSSKQAPLFDEIDFFSDDGQSGPLHDTEV